MADRSILLLLAVLGTLTGAARLDAADPVVLEQVVSRHDPNFDVARARLGAGRDGHVYLVSPGRTAGYALRVSPDGADRTGGPVGYAATAIAANKDGVTATAEFHFSHRVVVRDRRFAPVGHADDFLVSDQAGWTAPSDVQAGESGDFYAIDQHRNRVVRVSPTGRMLTTYPLDKLGEQSRGRPVGLRVREADRRLITAWPSGVVRASGFDGAPLWSVKALPAGDHLGGFDVADDGRLYVLPGDDAVKVFDPDGKPVGEVKLKAAEKAAALTDLRVRGGELVVKRADPTTLFEVYDRATGDLIRRVPADVERLTVTYPSAAWTAGQPVPFATTFDAVGRPTKPRFRVWLRALGVPEFAELPVRDGTVTPPADARGLYHVRVSPDVRGRAAEYVVDGVVEIRPPGAAGSVSIFTPLNRFYYGRGEPILVTVVARGGPDATLPANVVVRLKQGTTVAREESATLTNGRGEFTLSADASPGRYVLDADVPGFTVAPQHLEIGPGLKDRPRFRLVRHGDYAHGFPPGPRPDGVNLPRFADLPDAVADHLVRSRALGINLFVDRLGQAGQGLLGQYRPTPADAALPERLRADPSAVAPEKAVFEDPARRTVAGYGAFGIEEQGILLLMDAGLPVGTLFDRRSPDQMAKDLQSVTKDFLPYPAFRGWSWAANWWQEKHGADAAADAAQKAAYEAALKAAKEKGTWSPVLDTVSDRTFAHAVDAEKRFRAALHAVAPGKVSAMTAPYRAIQAHPPVIFRNADEVDLHYQAEQIQPPQVTGHHVDFYRRPGKPAWGHPELWNDDGTGGMILPALFQMAMRGADGVGTSGSPGGSIANPDRDDPRSGGAGAASVIRAAYDVLRRHGPRLAAGENADRVAIVVSTRMQRIETWDGKIGGAYFDSLFEAYNACLYAHRPASFVFAEDLKPDTLAKFKAVLVVAQRVELDPPLAEALKAAAAAGVKVFHDGGCRPDLVKGFAPLGVTFDRVKQDPHAWQDDAAYDRFPRYFRDHAAVLRKVLGPVVPPVAECDQPEVLLTERRAGGVRYVWAVNNTMLGWDPGVAWRVSLLLSHRVPVVANLKVAVPDGHRVFDLFAGKEAPHDGGAVTADLRTLPARVFAILPPGTEPPDGEPVEGRFGPHVRDIAVSPDGSTAILNCFNWDHNLYGLDPATGGTRFRAKVGHAFTFSPTALREGFAVQGFDVTTAEGHHLYRIGPDGNPDRRFAMFGLQSRATNWASAEAVRGPGRDAFAAAPDGSWVAAAGDLGVVVWDRDGKQLWADEWWKTTRKEVRLVALDAATLVTLDGGTATARSARDGKPVWSRTPAESGTLLGGVVSGDRTTLVLRSDAVGGRLFVVRGGKLTNTLPARAGDLSVSADGSFLAATDGRQLKAFDTTGGLSWTYTGDDSLRRPRVSPDGTRVAVGSELGTLTVLTRDGVVVGEKDLHALPVPVWLPGGDLLAATWMGGVTRFDPTLTVKWQRSLGPAETDARSKLLAPDRAPTTRVTTWAAAAARSAPAAKNLLAGSPVLVTAEYDPKAPGPPPAWQNPVALLTDGKPAAPPRPWFAWTDVGMMDSGWKGRLTVQVDTFRTQLRVTGVSFVEDPARPESWLRDARLQWWDAAAGAWRDGPLLLSDAAAHTHVLDPPIEAAKFRIVSSGNGPWPAGNLRLAELAFHGQSLGASHPDALAKKPAAVLFDEREEDLRCLIYPGKPFRFRYDGAFAGGKCLELSAAGETAPEWQREFGHAVPHWDFEIAERPKPGQYRYLQFAWKAGSDKTTGVGLLLGKAWPGGGLAVTVGNVLLKEGVTAEHRVAGKPPTGWTTVRVDLWAAFKGKPPPIQSLYLKSVGGGALFDQIVLGRTETDLPPAK